MEVVVLVMVVAGDGDGDGLGGPPRGHIGAHSQGKQRRYVRVFVGHRVTFGLHPCRRRAATSLR